jgi:hypothetical protein
MLKVQQYLRDGRPVEALASELGIGAFHHPSLPLVGLKYQSHAPRAHPLVKECRGLVLEAGSWDVVAKPFDRFYNAGEDPDGFSAFRWERCTCQSKEDGSLTIVYSYGGAWHVNSSGSFGFGKVGSSRRPWSQLFWSATRLGPDRLDARHTYVFELCSPHSQVVRAYPETVAYLLSMFDPATCREFPAEAVDEEAGRLGMRRPEIYRVGSMDEVAALLEEKERTDPTFEGVILRDDADLRFKIKTRTYLEAHHAAGVGNLFHPRTLVPLILSGEIDEVTAYYPEVRPAAEEVRRELDAAWDRLREVWSKTWEIGEQKDFAHAIVGTSPFAGMLFTLRKQHGAAQTEEHLHRLWLGGADAIVKVLFEQRDR